MFDTIPGKIMFNVQLAIDLLNLVFWGAIQFECHRLFSEWETLKANQRTTITKILYYILFIYVRTLYKTRKLKAIYRSMSLTNPEILITNNSIEWFEIDFILACGVLCKLGSNFSNFRRFQTCLVLRLFCSILWTIFLSP